MMEVPIEFTKYQLVRGYFVMNNGDIYFGHLRRCHGYDDGVFIIQPDKKKLIKDLSIENQTPEVFRRAGYEIRNFDNVFKVLPEESDIGIEEDLDLPTRYNPKKKARTLYCFGAGASAYCVHGEHGMSYSCAENPNWCPIGNAVLDRRFKAIYSHFPSVDLTWDAFTEAGEDVEKCLQEEWNNLNSGNQPQVMQRHINLQYYLQRLFQEVSRDVVMNWRDYNLYAKFAHKLEKQLGRSNEHALVVTFNQDTILDHFIEQRFGRFDRMDDYIDYNNRDVLLFRPHGSADWGWKLNPQELQGCGPENLPQFLYESKTTYADIAYRIAGDLNEMVAKNSWGEALQLQEHRLGRFTMNKERIEKIQPGNLYFPAVLLPYRDKDEMVMPYKHHYALQFLLGDVEEICLIGWKGNEKVFNALLKQQLRKLKKVTVVNPEPELVWENVADSLPIDHKQVEIINTFEEFVLNKM